MVHNFAEAEKKILQFWEKEKIFQKLRQKNAKSKKRWSFLDGPITANNPMGVHHAWGRTYKDLMQRYHAMKGFDQRYQNGFDCQGLWVEVEVEKELGFKNKKDIEAFGVDKFVELCKERVKKYSAIQTAQSVRLGQWMDWENSYYTMSDENNYTIWHFLKKCWEKEYIYKGRDSVPWCPRCGTAISQHEILTEEYKEIVHDSIYFALPIIGKKGEFLLVWTTTPWTLPANIAVAVDEKIEYALVEHEGKKFWLAEKLVQKVFEQDFKIIKTAKGKSLEGLKYSFAFDELPRVKEVAEKHPKTFHTVIATDERIMPINIEDGTGLVHTAVSAGAEDFQLGKKLGLPMVEVIGEDAVYLSGLGEFSGQNAKKNPKIILDYLMAHSQKYVFEILPYKHKYPTCWRCKTELVWRVVDEWYISMEKLRKPLEEIVKKINWIPAFGKERELDWIKNMHDWLISKKRYWGLALPIFECQQCGNFEVIGSKEELKKRAVEGWETFEGKSPHKPWIDAVKIKCKKCKAAVSRIKDVGNPWLDAGIVPFSTMGYLGDKKYWKKWFPAEVVAESFPGQFKNWFYSLLVMSAVLEDAAPVNTIFGYALVKDEKGNEMHKSAGNAIWFDEGVEKMGADPMRWFYMRSNPAENLLFGYKTVDEVKKKLLVLHNVYTFFLTYVGKADFPGHNAAPGSAVLKKIKPSNVLDKWILSKMAHVVTLAEFNFDTYDIAKAVATMEDFFINDLSLWYIRRSRKRFHEASPERKESIETFYVVLLNTAKIIAPAMPFFAEEMYQSLKIGDMPESVHLFAWPSDELHGHVSLELEQNMDEVRKVVALALAERNARAVKIRQPLASLKIRNKKSKIKNHDELLDLIKDEVNVKEILFDATIEGEVALDLNITQELKEEGMVREMVRFVQEMRKEAGLKPTDEITISFEGADVSLANQNLIARGARAVVAGISQPDLQKEMDMEGKKIIVKIKKHG